MLACLGFKLSIFCSSQIVYTIQPVHLIMTLTFPLISIVGKYVKLSDFAEKWMASCSVSVYRNTRSQTGCVLILFHLEIIGDQYKLSGIFLL